MFSRIASVSLGHAGRKKSRNLQRILQRAVDSSMEVVLGHAQVVLPSNRFGVPQPFTDDVSRKHVFKFGLAAGSKVVHIGTQPTIGKGD